MLAQLDEYMVLLLGMMADASDEVLTLVRFFDREAFAIEQMAERVQTFKHTLSALFLGGGCLRTGFTRLCLQHLQTQKLFSDGAGSVRGVGGLTLVDLAPEGPLLAENGRLVQGGPGGGSHGVPRLGVTRRLRRLPAG